MDMWYDDSINTRLVVIILYEVVEYQMQFGGLKLESRLQRGWRRKFQQQPIGTSDEPLR